MVNKIICVLLFALLLCGCATTLNSPVTSCSNSEVTETQAISDSSWLVGKALPRGMKEGCSIRNMPTRQQFCYQSKDGTSRVVLDVQRENADIVSVSKKEDIAIGQASRAAYVYQGEAISYPSLEDAISENPSCPMENETVLEWQQGNGFCRLFGSISKADLIAYAATVEVNIR